MKTVTHKGKLATINLTDRAYYLLWLDAMGLKAEAYPFIFIVPSLTTKDKRMVVRDYGVLKTEDDQMTTMCYITYVGKESRKEWTRIVQR